jgi:hypothetical protein
MTRRRAPRESQVGLTGLGVAKPRPPRLPPRAAPLPRAAAAAPLRPNPVRLAAARNAARWRRQPRPRRRVPSGPAHAVAQSKQQVRPGAAPALGGKGLGRPARRAGAPGPLPRSPPPPPEHGSLGQAAGAPRAPAPARVDGEPARRARRQRAPPLRVGGHAPPVARRVRRQRGPDAAHPGVRQAPQRQASNAALVRRAREGRGQRPSPRLASARPSAAGARASKLNRNRPSAPHRRAPGGHPAQLWAAEGGPGPLGGTRVTRRRPTRTLRHSPRRRWPKR